MNNYEENVKEGVSGRCEMCEREIELSTDDWYTITTEKRINQEGNWQIVCSKCYGEFTGLIKRLSRDDLVEIDIDLDYELYTEMNEMASRANVSIEDLIKVILCLEIRKYPDGLHPRECGALGARK
jgi:hypothetical protein